MRCLRDAVVVKIGGSLLGQSDLDTVLDRIIRAKGPLVVVPGGGPFAEAVREAQRILPFSEGLAHRLAINGMGAFAQILCERHHGFVLAPSRRKIVSAWIASSTPVWDASETIGRRDIPESWEVTSDSLAAWLAVTISARALILVKSATLELASATQELSRAGVLDSAFQRYASLIAGSIVCVGRQDWDNLDLIIDRMAGPKEQGIGPPSSVGLP